MPLDPGLLRSQWRNTPYNETAEGSPELAMVQDGTRLSRVFKVLWDDDDLGSAVDGTAQRDFIGYAQVKTILGKRTIVRKTPFVYEKITNSDEKPYLFCTGCPSSKGVGPLGADGDGVQTFDHAMLTLELRSLPWPVMDDDAVRGPVKLGDGVTANPWAGIPDEGAFAINPALRRYVTRFARQGGKIIGLPQGMMRVVKADGTAGDPIREGLPLRQTSAQVIYTHHFVPEDGVPWKAAEALSNTINNAAFDVWSAQTLLFESMDVKTIVSPLGDKIADVQFTFKWLPNVNRTTTQMVPVDAAPPAANSVARGHNWIIRRVGGVLDYWRVTSDGTAATGTPSYATSDFGDLFRPDQT